MQKRWVEMSVGLFMVLGLAGFLFLAFRVSGLTSFSNQHSFTVQAEFDNIGELKVRAPVTIAGVRIGEVSRIDLVPNTFNAIVTMRINANQNKIPLNDTSVRILTQGLLGANYLSIVPGFEGDGYLQNGSRIVKTQSAMILENLIGQLLFKVSEKS